MLKYSEASILLHMIKKRNGNKMTKEEVVELMTNTIIALNSEIGHQQNVPQEDIDKAIETTRPQFNSINSILYEVLKANKIIN